MCGRCERFQVVRVDASRILTPMMNLKPFRYWPIGLLIVVPMRGHAASSIYNFLSVTKSGGGSLPYPASGDLINDVFHGRLTGMMTGNKAHRASNDVPQPTVAYRGDGSSLATSTLAEARGVGVHISGRSAAVVAAYVTVEFTLDVARSGRRLGRSLRALAAAALTEAKGDGSLIGHLSGPNTWVPTPGMFAHRPAISFPELYRMGCTYAPI
jgi:hypothetical protein